MHFRLDLTAHISIHALRKESDLKVTEDMTVALLFQSTLSVRRATGIANGNATTDPFQSTLSVRRATIFDTGAVYGSEFQSTLSVRRAT